MGDAFHAQRRTEGLRFEGAELRPDSHDVAVEAPLEIRIAGEPVATTMRTPGDDRFLALGFLYAEGVVRSLGDVGSVYHCGRSDAPGYGNTIELVPGPGVSLDVDRLLESTRRSLTTSACGLCGRATIDSLLERTAPVTNFGKLPPALIARVPDLLSAGQVGFALTGGVHAAAAISLSGEVLATCEDVGRHNAVDKLVGRLLYAGLVPRERGADAGALVLGVSGRASCEIVQKAAMAGFVAVVSVSAASTLAIDTAEALGITLVSFAREGRFTVYTHAERLQTSA